MIPHNPEDINMPLKLCRFYVKIVYRILRKKDAEA